MDKINPKREFYLFIKWITFIQKENRYYPIQLLDRQERKHGFCSPKCSITIYTRWNLSEKI